ncbi:MAG: tyrosine-type recombinase/integrase, partial [Bdellovibrionales bacterium]|nr:tyrosine-type recombinase/integrase [Bdellovibrionales bacterium]
MLTHLVEFLKNLHYIEGASPLTIKAYSLDLFQAFQALNVPRLGLSESQGSLCIDAEQNTEILWSEDQLLSATKEALNRWSSLSPASRQRKCASLKSFFGYLFREEITERDLGAQIVLPKSKQKIPHFISVDEIISLLTTIKLDIEKNHRETHQEVAKAQALILLLYGGGLRVSEACTLMWSQLNIKQRTILVRGKGGKERQIVVPAVTMRAIEELERSSDYLFGDKPLGTRTAYSWVREWGARAG